MQDIYISRSYYTLVIFYSKFNTQFSILKITHTQRHHEIHTWSPCNQIKQCSGYGDKLHPAAGGFEEGETNT